VAQNPFPDPELDAQLYGAPTPTLADTAPATSGNPWDWIPPSWQDPEELARARQQLGPSGVPLDAATAVAAGQAAQPDAAAAAPAPMPEDQLLAAYQADLADPAKRAQADEATAAYNAANPPEQPPAAPPDAATARELLGAAATGPTGKPLTDDQVLAAYDQLHPTLGPPTQLDAATAAGFGPPAPAPPLPMPFGAAGPAPLPAPGPPVLGPQPATVGDLVGPLTFDAPPLVGNAAAAAADPLATRQGIAGPEPILSDEEAGRAIANMAPEQQIAVKAKLDAARANDFATKLHDESVANLARAKQNEDAAKAGYAHAQQKAAELEHDTKALAAQQISDGWSDRPAYQKVAGFVAAIVGGLVSGRTGRPNAGMAMVQKVIDDSVEQQKANLANRRALLGQRQNAVGEMFSRTGDLYRAAETSRAAMWEATIQDLQAQQQMYDPHGTNALTIAGMINDARARQAAGMTAYVDKQEKYGVERYKLVQKDREIAETERAARAKEAEAAAKLAAKGAGGGAGVARVTGEAPKYTVDTGFTNPFDPSQPVLGTRPIGGKHEGGEKEFKTVSEQLGIYAHVQDYWQKLAAVGAKIDYHKGLGEQAWGKLKNTDAAEYDSAKEALVVYLTKELGDKLTQGQLEAQAHRIPERSVVFESREPGKQIADAQADADRDFARDMTLVGIDPTPIIKSAQQRRAVSTPSAAQDLEAAQAAAAANPADKDAQRALEAATQRQTAENEAHVAGQQAMGQAAHAGGHKPLPTDNLPPSILTEVQKHNGATETYNLAAEKYRALSASAPPAGKLKGDNAKAAAAHERQLEAQALAVKHARTAVDNASAAILPSISAAVGSKNYGGIPHDRLATLANILGIDPPPERVGDINAQVAAGKFAGEVKRRIEHATATQRHRIQDAFFGPPRATPGHRAPPPAQVSPGPSAQAAPAQLPVAHVSYADLPPAGLDPGLAPPGDTPVSRINFADLQPAGLDPNLAPAE